MWGYLGVGPKCCGGDVGLFGIKVYRHVTLSQIYRGAKINSKWFTVLWGYLGVGPKCYGGDVRLFGIKVYRHVTLSQIYRVASRGVR